MTESSPVDVSRQRLLHSVQRPEGPQRAPLTPESKAPHFEGAVRSLIGKGVREEERVMVQRNLENGFRKTAAWIVDRSGLVLSNYGDLEDLVFDENRLNILPENKAKAAKELCYSMMDGVTLGFLFDDLDPKLESVLKSKGEKVEKIGKIEVALGKGVLEGIGSLVVETTITSDELKRALHVLQNKIQPDGTFKKVEIVKVMDKIDDWVMNGEVSQSESNMVIAYLTAFMTNGAEEIQEKEVLARIEESRLQKEYYQRQVELGKRVEKVTYDEWLDSLMNKPSPASRQASLWELEPPKWLESQDLKEWRDILSMADGMSIVVAQRRRDDGFMTSIDRGGVKEKTMSLFNLPEKYLKWLYEHKTLGFRPALEMIVGDLFTRNSDGIFEFEDPEINRQVETFLLDSGEYKKAVARRLLDRGKVKSLDQGYVAISMAADFLELGNQIEVADTNRKVGYASDALRTVLRPANKFSKKAEGGELWGGSWSNYLMGLYGKDKVMDAADKMGIIPHVLCGSIMNAMFDAEGGGRIALGDALITGRGVEFSSSEGDVYFTTKKKVLAACDIWTYISGGKPLQFKSIDEFDNVLSEWKKGLHNAVIELSDEGEKHNLRGNITPGVVAAAIGGSTGLWPFEGPYLWITEDPSEYREMTMQIVDQVVADEEQKRRLRDFFGISGDNVFKENNVFSKKVGAYQFSIGNFPKWSKNIFGQKKLVDLRSVKIV